MNENVSHSLLLALGLLLGLCAVAAALFCMGVRPWERDESDEEACEDDEVALTIADQTPRSILKTPRYGFVPVMAPPVLQRPLEAIQRVFTAPMQLVNSAVARPMQMQYASVPMAAQQVQPVQGVSSCVGLAGRSSAPVVSVSPRVEVPGYVAGTAVESAVQSQSYVTSPGAAYFSSSTVEAVPRSQSYFAASGGDGAAYFASSGGDGVAYIASSERDAATYFTSSRRIENETSANANRFVSGSYMDATLAEMSATDFDAQQSRQVKATLLPISRTPPSGYPAGY